MARPEKVRLGEILLRQGLLTEDQLKSALEDQKRFLPAGTTVGLQFCF